MEVPLNSIHTYIGFPILLGLGIDSMRRYRKNRNTTSLYIGLACTLAGVAMIGYGVPALFTHNPRELSLGTMIGDITLALCMMFLWFICNRAFLGGRQGLVKLANSAAVLLVILLSIDTVQGNLFAPYGTQIVQNPGGGIALAYKEDLSYMILSTINSISLVLIAIFFWRQGNAIPNAGQRLRVRSIAVGFVLATGPFITASILPASTQAKVSVILWSLAMIALAVMNAIGAALSKRQVNEQPST